MNFPDGSVKRTYLPFLGVDILTVTGAAAVRHAVNTGDLVRLSDMAPTTAELPWPFRVFFSLSRFWSPAHGYFMPMRADGDDMATRGFLDTSFADGAEDGLREYARAAAALIADPDSEPSNRALGGAFARALASRFVPGRPLPDSVLDAASKQIGTLADAFTPWKRVVGGASVKFVYDFFAKEWFAQDREAKGLPSSSVVDVSHAVFASFMNGPPALRSIQKDPDMDVGAVFAHLGAVEQVLRMTKRETTLGGLIDADRPIIPGATVVALNIRKAAADTGDHAWAFGVGDEKRRCAAEGEILRFSTMVQEEVKAMRIAKTSN